MTVSLTLGHPETSELDRKTSPRRLRVLVLAEECNPLWSSVPLVGYNFAKALADRPDLEVTLATNARNRSALADDRLPCLVETHYLDTESVSGPLFRLGRRLRGGETLGWSLNTALSWPGYLLFEREVYRRLDLGSGRAPFDLIHRVTPVSPTLGSPLASWCEIPMVVGPLNGGLPWPTEFPELRQREGEWLTRHRGLFRWLPYARSTYQRAAGVLVASRATAEDLPEGPGPRRLLSENGVDPERFPVLDKWRPPQGPFRFVTAGRLAPVKAIDLILLAMAGSSTLRHCGLTIVGDGPERPRLEQLVADQELGEAVRFTGWLDQKGLAAELARSQVFVFPSIKEFGGGVVVEAMASALPSIVTDYGGPSELISPETGRKLPLAPAGELVGSLRLAMEELAGDFSVCRRLGEAASRRAREQFVWSAKAEAVVAFYREILAARGFY